MSNELQRWHELDTSLLLDGAEEGHRPALRVFRDGRRPRVWDRQIALPIDLPADVEHEVRAIDEYYRAIDAQQWSIVGVDGPRMTAWSAAVEPLGLSRETQVVMVAPIVASEIAPSVGTFDGPDRFERLEELSHGVRVGSSGASVVSELVDLYRERVDRGVDVVILAAEAGGELVSYIILSIVGERSWMEDLETRSDRRRHGHARALMAAASTVARARGARSAGFVADEADWMWHWYERLGYRPIGRIVRLRRQL